MKFVAVVSNSGFITKKDYDLATEVQKQMWLNRSVKAGIGLMVAF